MEILIMSNGCPYCGAIRQQAYYDSICGDETMPDEPAHFECGVCSSFYSPDYYEKMDALYDAQEDTWYWD